MGKAHESAKEARKQAQHTAKEKRAAKHAKKEEAGSPPFMGHHYKAEPPL